MKKIILIFLISFINYSFAQNAVISKTVKDFLFDPRSENQIEFFIKASKSYEKNDGVFNREYFHETYFNFDEILAELETSRIIPNENFPYNTVLWRIESLKIKSNKINLKYNLKIGDKINDFKKILSESYFTKINDNRFKIEINEFGRTNQMFFETNKNDEVVSIEMTSFKSY